MRATPVWTVLSRTGTVTVWGRFGVSVAANGNVICVADWFSDQKVVPAALSVNVKGAVEADVIQMLTHVVPLTVCPALGRVTASETVPPAPPPLFTVTVRVAVAVCAPASVTVRPSV